MRLKSILLLTVLALSALAVKAGNDLPPIVAGNDLVPIVASPADHVLL